MALLKEKRLSSLVLKAKNKLSKDNDDIPKKYTGAVVSAWEDGRELYRRDDLTSLVNAFKDWVFICASRNASCVAKGTFKLFVATKKGQRLIAPTRDIDKITLKWLESNGGLHSYLQKAVSVKEVINHPFIDLIKSPNPFMDRYTLLETTALFLELTGNAYWYIFKDKLGVPRQIWVIPSQNMLIVPSKEKFIAGYIFKRGTETVPFDLNEIVHFKFPNPHNLYYGMAPHASIVNELNTKENMDKFENALYTNNCRMEGVLETDMELSQTTFDRMKEQWKQNYGGVNKAGKTAILEKGLKYHSITFPPKDLNNLQGRKNYREIVAAVFGVPMSMLTTENTNLANAYVGDRQYYSNTILPRDKRLEGGINTKLLSLYDDSIFLAFDNPVPDDNEFLLRKNVAEVKAGIRTRNEVRLDAGLEPRPEGDKLEIGNTGFAKQGAPIGNQNAEETPE